MEYTEGEWSRLETDEGKLHIIRTLPNGGVNRICEIVIPSTGYRVEAEANAHLIAAAPEMYEALKTVKVDINWMLNNQKFLNPEVFDYVDRAIAKAEGGQDAKN